MWDSAGALKKKGRCSHLFPGNCLKALACLPDQSVDCIITDPPYGICCQCQSRTVPLDLSINDDKEVYTLLDRALLLACQKLKENSHIYVFTSWQTCVPMAAVVKKHFTLKNMLVWVKNSRARGDLKGNYGNQYEMILYAHKGRRYLSGKRDANILCFDAVSLSHMLHPTEKPVALIEYLLTKSTAEGETVLDMFMGVGTTCIAAQRTNRQYIGMELEPGWFSLASQRLEAR